MKWNVIADGWTAGKYCLASHVNSKEAAERWASWYRTKYENKPYPNKRGWYTCHNFRVVPIEDNQSL